MGGPQSKLLVGVLS